MDRQLVLVNGEAPYLGPPTRRASRRDLPLARVAADALAAHLAPFPTDPQEILVRDAAGRATTATVALVFARPSGAPIRRNGFSTVWRQAVQAAGAPAGSTFHDPRHFHASLLVPAWRVGEGRADAARPCDRCGDAGHLLAPVAGL